MPAEKLPDRKQRKHVNSIMKISEWKQKIIESLVLDDQLSKLLWYNSADALSRKSLTEDQKYELADSSSDMLRVHGTMYTPEVMMDQKTFIGMSIANFGPQEIHYQLSNRFLIGYLYIYILVDNKIMVIDEGWRQDKILERIYDILEGSRMIGMGEMQLGNFNDLWEQNNKFGGYTVMMKIYDFM